MTDPAPQLLALASIRTDGGTQPRAQLDAATVAEYAEAMARGEVFPAVDVFYDGSVYWLADGFHRLEAARQAGKDALPATVHQGSVRDAVLFSVGANAEHGARRSSADTKRAIATMLQDEEWSQWPNTKIAAACHVTEGYVRKVRAELRIIVPSTKMVQRGDTSYSMKTGGIGKNQPAPARADPPLPAPTAPVDRPPARASVSVPVASRPSIVPTVDAMPSGLIHVVLPGYQERPGVVRAELPLAEAFMLREQLETAIAQIAPVDVLGAIEAEFAAQGGLGIPI